MYVGTSSFRARGSLSDDVQYETAQLLGGGICMQVLGHVYVYMLHFMRHFAPPIYGMDCLYGNCLYDDLKCIGL